MTWGSRARWEGAEDPLQSSIPWRGPATVQVVHLAWVEQVVKLPQDPGKRET